MQYLDDGKIEVDVPADELRLISEKDRVERQSPPPATLSFPLGGILNDREDNDGHEIVKTPRAIVHRKGSAEHDEDSDVLVIEGQQEHLATGGGVRGIRFLKNSTRA